MFVICAQRQKIEPSGWHFIVRNKKNRRVNGIFIEEIVGNVLFPENKCDRNVNLNIKFSVPNSLA